MLQNLETLSLSRLLEDVYHVLDRGYDASWVMRHYEAMKQFYIIRAVRTRMVAEESYFGHAIGSYSTHMERNSLFESAERFKAGMKFFSHPLFPWFQIAWARVCRKGESYPSDPEDVIRTTLIVVRITDAKVQ